MKKRKLRKINFNKLSYSDLDFIFFKYKKRLDNYISNSEMDRFLIDKNFKINKIEYKEEDNLLYKYFIFKKNNDYLMIRYNEKDIFSIIRIIENNILKSYYLNTEKIKYLLENTEKELLFIIENSSKIDFL